MKVFVKMLTLSLFLSNALTSCKKEDKFDTGKPTIKYVSFAGFPVTIIQFDKSLRTISLQIPAVLPVQGLVPAFGLSENAKIVQGLTPTGKLDLSLIDLCKRSDEANREVEVIVANQAGTDSTAYRVVLVPPDGCPAIQDRGYNYLFTRSDGGKGAIEYYLPLKNAYQNFRIRSLRFTVMRNGGVRTVYEPDLNAYACLVRYDGDHPNQLTTSYGQDILNQNEFWSEISFTTDCDTNRVSFYKYY